MTTQVLTHPLNVGTTREVAQGGQASLDSAEQHLSMAPIVSSSCFLARWYAELKGVSVTKEMLDIVQTVPSILDRAELLNWMAREAAEKKRLKQASSGAVVESVCQWIDRTWPHPQRVRHHAARMVARKLRAGALDEA